MAPTSLKGFFSTAFATAPTAAVTGVAAGDIPTVNAPSVNTVTLTVSDTPKTPDATKTGDATKTPDAAKAPEALDTPKAPEAPTTPEMPKAPDTSKAQDTSKTPEAKPDTQGSTTGKPDKKALRSQYWADSDRGVG